MSAEVVLDAPRSEDLAAVARLRNTLTAVGFTAAGVGEHLGEAAVQALSRDQAAPALRALAHHADRGSRSALSTVIELFILARPVPEGPLVEALAGVVATTLPPESASWTDRGEVSHSPDLPEAADLADLTDLLDLGLVERGPDGTVRSTVDLDLHSADDGLELWVASDLTAFQRPGTLRHDHVLGIGGASLTLAQITERRTVRRALDIGTGCGVQVFHLLSHADHVVATDLSDRALAFARFNLVLNAPALGVDPEHLEQRVELRQGSLLEPVAGERFDLVVTNPPFVITPRGRSDRAADGAADTDRMQEPQSQEHRYTYRDGGRAGDTLVAELIGGLEAVMAPGATAHLLANWEIPRVPGWQPQGPGQHSGQDWTDRVASWIPENLDAWVIQRETETPEGYAETWLRDASEHLDRGSYEASYLAYLEDFASREVGAIGFGYVRLEAPTGPREHRRRYEHLSHPLQQPISHATAATVAREVQLDQLGQRWQQLHLVVPEHVTEERHLPPGAEDPSVILLRQGSGLQRSNVLTSATAGLVGACDGELSVAQIVTALGALLGWESPAEQSPEGRAVLEETRHLIVDGFLLPQ